MSDEVQHPKPGRLSGFVAPKGAAPRPSEPSAPVATAPAPAPAVQPSLPIPAAPVGTGSKSLTLRLPDAEYERLRARAFTSRMSHQAILAEALRQYLDAAEIVIK